MGKLRQLALLALAVWPGPGCTGDEPDPGKPPPGNSSGNVTTAGGQSTTDATTGAGSATGSGTMGGSGSGTGGASGSGSSGGADPYGPCPGLVCPAGQLCMESLQSPGYQICTDVCVADTDCSLPTTGTAVPVCAPNESGGDTVCRLDCSGNQICPDGAVCVSAWCWHG